MARIPGAMLFIIGLFVLIFSIVVIKNTGNNRFTIFAVIGAIMAILGLGRMLAGRKVAPAPKRVHEQKVRPRRYHYCPNCGRHISHIDRFCPHCGAKLR